MVRLAAYRCVNDPPEQEVRQTRPLDPFRQVLPHGSTFLWPDQQTRPLRSCGHALAISTPPEPEPITRACSDRIGDGALPPAVPFHLLTSDYDFDPPTLSDGPQRAEWGECACVRFDVRFWLRFVGHVLPFVRSRANVRNLHDCACFSQIPAPRVNASPATVPRVLV